MTDHQYKSKRFFTNSNFVPGLGTKTPDNHLIIRGFCFYRAY